MLKAVKCVSKLWVSEWMVTSVNLFFQMSGRQEDEEYEVLDLAAIKRNQTAFKRMLGDVTKQSVAKQIAIGGAAGW